MISRNLFRVLHNMNDSHNYIKKFMSVLSQPLIDWMK